MTRRSYSLSTSTLFFPSPKFIFLTMGLLIANPGSANDWLGTNSSNWFDGGNWSTGIPIAGDNVIINTITPNSTVLSAGASTIQNITIGDNSSGQLAINGATLNDGIVRIGQQVGGNGVVTVNNSTWANTGFINVGESGQGNLSITNGSTVTADSMSIGFNSGSSGILLLDNGTLSMGNSLTIGTNASATVNVLNGSTLTNGQGALGFFATGNATVNVNNSVWNNTGNLFVGVSGNGTLNIANGGVVNNQQGLIGFSAGGVGSLTVSDANSLWNSTIITVGSSGNGTLTVTNAGRVNSTGAFFSNALNAVALITITGANSLWNNTGAANVGNIGSAVLNILNGGTATSNSFVLGVSATGQGQLAVNDGTLNVTTSFIVGSSGSALVNILNGGQVTANNSRIGLNATGSGIATVSGAGSQWTNNTLLRIGQSGTGTLNIQNGGVVNNLQADIGFFAGSNGTVNVSGANSTWNNSQLLVGNAGNGSLNISNGGTVNATNVFISSSGASTGTTTVDGSAAKLVANALQVGAGGSSGSLVVQNSGLVQIAQITTLGPTAAILQLLSNGVLETTQLLANGATITTNFNGGVLRANGANSNFIDGFSSGQLTLNGNGLAIDSNGFDIATDNVFSGTGGLTKIGTGTLSLNADQLYTGLTSVNAGTLRIDTILAGAMQILSGGRLQGNGTVGSTTVAGTIAPGNSIGILHIAGNYIQLPGSIYEVEINPAGQSDLLQITGTATLFGGSVRVLKATGIYTPDTRYTILTALGGVVGQYDNLVQNLPFINIALLYDAQNVYLEISRNLVNFASAATTLNQRNTANAAESLGRGNLVYDAISNINSSLLAPAAFDALSGEIHSSTLGAFIEESRYLRNTALSRLEQIFSNGLEKNEQIITASGINLWGQGFGSWGELDGNGNATTTNRHAQGFFIGAEEQMIPALRLGVLTGVSNSDINLYARRSWVASENYHLGLYAGAKISHLNLRTGAGYTWHDLTTRRNIQFPLFSDYVKSFSNAQTKQLFAELGYPIQFSRASIEPFIGGAFVDVAGNPYYERGGAAALHGYGQENTFYTSAGARQNASLLLTEKIVIAERLTLAWQRANHHLNPQSVMEFTSGSLPFTIYGSPIAKSSLLIDAGLILQRPDLKRFKMKMSYIGQRASHVKDNGLAGTVIYQME